MEKIQLTLEGNDNIINQNKLPMIPIIIAFVAGMISYPFVSSIVIVLLNRIRAHNNMDDGSAFNEDGTPKRIIFKSDNI